MSKVNFFHRCYQTEYTRKDDNFGIVDGVDNIPAYTTIDKQVKWNAIVENPNHKSLLFVPVDNNIIIYKSNGKDKESTCDGMLLCDESRLLAFVELKDVRVGGMSDAIDQLRNTINIFLINHQFDILRVRRAYAANIAHPQFHYNMKDEIESFKKIHFILYPEATITIT